MAITKLYFYVEFILLYMPNDRKVSNKVSLDQYLTTNHAT